MKKSLIISALLLLSATTVSQAARISINSIDNGAQWQLCPADSVGDAGGAEVSTTGFTMPTSAVAGVVPGCVFTAYVEAGLEEDPNYADNIYRVDETFYSRPFWYRAELRTPKEMKKGQRLWLHFMNTNRYADYWFNGHKISGTAESTRDVSGHMMRFSADVTDLLAPDGRNTVAVLITDADQKKTRKADGPYGVACSPSYLAGAGWDWMPYVPGRLNGIVGKAFMEVTGDAVMTDPWVRADLNDTFDRADVEISTTLTNTAPTPRRITLDGTINPGNIHFSKTYILGPGASTNATITKADAPKLEIENPRLWWPNGYGEPNMYTCRLQVKNDDKLSQEQTIDFGIRKYGYETVENAVGMPVWRFSINGRPVFLKGGNWGMSEYLLRCHDKQYEDKIRLHKELNYNVIRLWTGCVTDDEFYDYCDRYGLMVWNDFWLYVAYNDVAEPEAFKANARDKVRRLRNHPCILLWCGANETHPAKDLDDYLRAMVAEEDKGDRMYKSCSNQDGLSGSGWWCDFPPRHHFETSVSNLAFNKPAYPYGIDHGYGMRSEIGMCTFPAYESVIKFIPEDCRWPLPDEDAITNDDFNVWNRHFFGKEASNAKPFEYMQNINARYGESQSLEEFCEKAQLLNIEDMKGMYEAWNDKMWNDAAGLILWMSQSAYPSFVWQTFDYYYDCGGAYWGARKACEHRHVQWNNYDNTVKIINHTREPLQGVTAQVEVFDMVGNRLEGLCQTSAPTDVAPANIATALTLDFSSPEGMGVNFIRLKLNDAQGNLISDNFYWRNGVEDLNYKPLTTLPNPRLDIKPVKKTANGATVKVKNTGHSVAFAVRLRPVDPKTGESVLPVILNDNYFTLMPGEETTITIEYPQKRRSTDLLVKPFTHPETKACSL